MASAHGHEPWLADLCAGWRRRQDWVLQQQIACARIAAPTGNEGTRAAHVQQALAMLAGLSVSRDRSGNVCAVVTPTSRPSSVDDAAPIVCLAHLDTVYVSDDAVEVVRDGSRVCCPGIGDNGRGLAALLVLADTLHAPETRARLRRPVHLVATVGEEGEGNLLGARTWFDDAAVRGLRPSAAIAIDGPGDESIVHHAIGSLRLRITMRGSGGHPWVHAGAPNPIHALGAFIGIADRLGDGTRRQRTVTITRMHGGDSLTGIPQQAWVDLDARSPSAAGLARLRQELEHAAYAVARDATCHDPSRPLTVEVAVLGSRPAGALESESPLVQAAVRATQTVGRKPRSASASTDANVPLARGIPAIAIGAGGIGGGAHTRDEWYDDAHGSAGIERVLHLVLGLALALADVRPRATR
ncbi:MAG: M20/M25/M40 family metallo-hydrolase [Gemmatimonas sp.]|uniref:M20/M25/M40 family metallo-hydrolase n=1 Tax=Gemmatimonas sp. TaxID=1962908 RepID=UPI00391F4F63|nr:M20/M25/M40 family metallo-hydrolase [Gemmatimonadota bacterium]